MVTEAILNLLFGAAEGLLSLLPTIDWTVDTSAWSYAGDILSMIAYLLPWGTIRIIISSIVAITFMRISIAFIRTILGFIPFIG